MSEYNSSHLSVKNGDICIPSCNMDNTSIRNNNRVCNDCGKNVWIEWSVHLHMIKYAQHKYIPYSIRHEIPDTDLAWLLDYAERIMGWDIKAQGAFDDILYSYDLGKARVQLWHDGEIQFLYWSLDLRIPKDIFYRSYKTLLPVIRDLYSQ